MHKFLAVMFLANWGVVAAAGDVGCQQPCGGQVMYETREITLYKTVFEEVKETFTVPTTKFVPGTELREVPMTISQPCSSCGEGCASGCTTPCAPCQKAPCMTCIRRLPFPVMHEVPATKVIERKRVVEKQVPYTVTCYVPIPTCGVGCETGAPALLPVPPAGTPTKAAPAIPVTPKVK